MRICIFSAALTKAPRRDIRGGPLSGIGDSMTAWPALSWAGRPGLLQAFADAAHILFQNVADFLKGNGLGYIIIHARCICLIHVFHKGICGHGDNRNMACALRLFHLPYPACRFIAIHLRHLDSMKTSL